MNNGLASLNMGWAIAHKFDWGWSYLGYGWFDWKTYDHLEGVSGTCVFRTKKKALEGIKQIKSRRREKFRAVKVICSVIEARHL